MYAIQNIKTGKFVCGTDYRYNPHQQRTSKDKMLTYSHAVDAQLDFKLRQCGKDYRIVVLKTIEVERITDLHKHEIDLRTLFLKGVKRENISD